MTNSIQLSPFISGAGDAAAYIGWSPVRLIVTGRNEAGRPNVVRLRSQSLTRAGVQIEFKNAATGIPADEILLDLGEEGSAACFISGKFQADKPLNGASADGKDVAIHAAWADNPSVDAGAMGFMVRVRRDAESLNAKARNDFTSALAELNGYGRGIYVTDFVGMHVAGASESQHGDAHFLPWHRLYLLDLERQLQRINPAVTLPYWRFDVPAPSLFSEDFLGATESIPPDSAFTPGTSDKRARLSSSNDLSSWKIGNVNGIPRAAFFDTKTQAAPGLPAAPGRRAFQLRNEADTLALGGENNEFGALRQGFSGMEGTPHGAAHVSFNGYVNFVPVAPQDPLFFLLHCNVDRLWAMWQFLFDRDVAAERTTYPYQNKLEIGFNSPPSQVGVEVAFQRSGGISESVQVPTLFTGVFPDESRLVDALQWPWDDTWSKPYNLRPPGTRSRGFTESATGKPITERMPSITDALDAFGYHDVTNYLGFAYDDVPFDHERSVG
ncbi:MAG: tyrosinase family protein [Pseudomonadota bacterium]